MALASKQQRSFRLEISHTGVFGGTYLSDKNTLKRDYHDLANRI